MLKQPDACLRALGISIPSALTNLNCMEGSLTRADLPAKEPELSPGQRYGLLAAAIGAALLGLTMLDVEGTQALKRRHAESERTPECIVASAVFLGAAPAHAP